MPATEIAKTMMTLAGISYIAPDQSLISEIFCGPANPRKSEIIRELHRARLTRDWALVWGPTYTPEFDNMMFIVQHGTTGDLALILRGTVFDSLKSWSEDVATDQKRFDVYTDGKETWVANGFYDGFIRMLQSTSSGVAEGVNLTDFLKKNSKSCATVYVTGHSQGAGLMPLFLAWLNTEKETWSEDISLAGYGFAPPTPGDKRFADWVKSSLTSELYVNKYDIVPRGYAEIRSLISENIPEDVPADLVPIIEAAAVLCEEAARKGGGSWAQAGTVHTFDRSKVTGEDYLDLVGCQHSHFTYLLLMGAPLSGQERPVSRLSEVLRTTGGRGAGRQSGIDHGYFAGVIR